MTQHTGQIEIMGILVIILVLIIGGLGYLTFSLTDTEPGSLTSAEQAFLESFTTVLTTTNACTGSSTTIADTAAAHLTGRTYTCNGDTPLDILNTSINQTILPNTLDYQFGRNAYTLRIQPDQTNQNLTYRNCPPLAQSNRRAENQPVYTSYSTIRITLILCTG